MIETGNDGKQITVGEGQVLGSFTTIITTTTSSAHGLPPRPHRKRHQHTVADIARILLQDVNDVFRGIEQHGLEVTPRP